MSMNAIITTRPGSPRDGLQVTIVERVPFHLHCDAVSGDQVYRCRDQFGFDVMAFASAFVVGFMLPSANAVGRTQCDRLYHRAMHTTGAEHDRVMIRGALVGCFHLS